MVDDGKNLLNKEWVDKIYRFSYKRTRNTEDARDLSQEIMVQVLQAIKHGEEPKNINAWIWAIARNHWYKYLEFKEKETRIVRIEGGQLMPCDTGSQVNPEMEFINNETIEELNMSISLLSDMYRQMVILYYLREMSVAQIANELGIPEGTVKRRLFDIRTKIKKGMSNMEVTTSRASYAPITVELFGGYGAPRHWQYLKSTLVRNILAVSYEQPVGIEYLAKELGVARVYLEEELEELLRRGIMRCCGKNYVTNFIIFPAQLWMDFRVEVADAWEGLGREMIVNLTAIKDEIMTRLFHGQDSEWDYLLWIFLVFACQSFSAIAQKNYARRWEKKELGKHKQDYRLTGLIRHADKELNLPESDKIRYVEWSNLHTYFQNVEGYKGVKYANLFQHHPFPDRDGWIHAGNIGLLVRLSQQPNASLSIAEQEAAATLLERGLLVKEKDGLVPTIPMIEKIQWQYINSLIGEAIFPCVDDAVERVANLADSTLLPKVRKDLWEQYVNWIMMVCLNPLNHVLYQVFEEDLLPLPKNLSRAPHALYLLLEQ